MAREGWDKYSEKPSRTGHDIAEGESVGREDVEGGVELPPFDLAIKQVTFFYPIPTDEGKFNNFKAFHNRELLSLAKILNDSDKEAADEEEAVEEMGTPGANVVNICD